METAPANVSPSAAGRVVFLDGRGELPMFEITTPWSSAEIYLHGAHVTHFQKRGELPLLFLSQCSRFERDAPIRGGIPIIYPWFGKPSERLGQHGFARVQDWELKEIHTEADGGVVARLILPDGGGATEWPCAVECRVAVRETLNVELRVTNNSDREVTFENCLHTYFAVGDIGTVSVSGLKGVDYLNQPTGFSRHTQNATLLHIAEEVDRAYLDTRHTVEIQDASLGRTIYVEKEGSLSTVVWNPWVAKAKAMADFGDEEYRNMLCVESGNVAANAIKLPPGETARLSVILGSRALV